MRSFFILFCLAGLGFVSEAHADGFSLNLYGTPPVVTVHIIGTQTGLVSKVTEIMVAAGAEKSTRQYGPMHTMTTYTYPGTDSEIEEIVNHGPKESPGAPPPFDWKFTIPTDSIPPGRAGSENLVSGNGKVAELITLGPLAQALYSGLAKLNLDSGARVQGKPIYSVSGKDYQIACAQWATGPIQCTFIFKQ